MQHTELLVAFGGLPLKNSQADLGGAAVHETPMYLAELARRGVECVLISPLRDDMGADFKARWLAARPNTDTALMLAWRTRCTPRTSGIATSSPVTAWVSTNSCRT